MENPWTKKTKRDVYENPWIRVEEHQVVDPSGRDGIYGVVRPKNWAVAVLPMDGEGNCWIVGQYRFATDSYEWELPKGGCPIGEEGPMDAGRRELREETGIVATTWTRVLMSNLSNCFTDEVSFSYLAQHLSFGEPEPEHSEDIRVKAVPFDELVEMALSGGINCVLSQATILAVKALGYGG